MEKLFETLAEIENKANRIMEHAHSYQSTLENEKAEQLQKLETDYKNDLKEKISVLQAKIEQDISQRKDKLQSETQKQLQALNEIQEEDLIKLADKIVASILEGAVL